MSKNIVIIGDGQLAKMLCSFPGVLGYVKPDQLDVLYNLKGDRVESINRKKHFGVIGIANPRYKKESGELWLKEGNDLGTLIHPQASILGNPEIGKGTVILPFALIDNECTIGDSVYIGAHTVIHKSNVDECAHLTYGCQLIMSNVREGAVLGSNTTVLDCRTVGKYSVVGAGSTVNKDVPDGYKLIQEVKNKLTPIDTLEWNEEYFRNKIKFTGVSTAKDFA